MFLLISLASFDKLIDLACKSFVGSTGKHIKKIE